MAETIRVEAPIEMQDKVLATNQVHSSFADKKYLSIKFGADLGPYQKSILTYLTKKRWRGATQIEIAKQLNIDARNIYHYIKQLLAAQLVYVSLLRRIIHNGLLA